MSLHIRFCRSIAYAVLACAVFAVLAAGGCSGAQRPTPEKCEAIYAAAQTTCTIAFTKEADRARCLGAAAAIRLACLVNAETQSAASTGDTPGRTAKRAGAMADRLAQVWDALESGGIDPDAAEKYVRNGF